MLLYVLTISSFSFHLWQIRLSLVHSFFLILVALILVKSFLIPAVVLLKVIAALSLEKLATTTPRAVRPIIVIAVCLLTAHTVLKSTFISASISVPIAFIKTCTLSVFTPVIAVTWRSLFIIALKLAAIALIAMVVRTTTAFIDYLINTPCVLFVETPIAGVRLSFVSLVGVLLLLKLRIFFGLKRKLIVLVEVLRLLLGGSAVV